MMTKILRIINSVVCVYQGGFRPFRMPSCFRGNVIHGLLLGISEALHPGF
ncbi:MAG: hypothetical protein NTW71_14915 [Deltaproteobacteria bacterium]|nr:hypothetical protein [Deltaproteobacteria bacterium]